MPSRFSIPLLQKNLDLTSLKELPISYAWPPLNHHSSDASPAGDLPPVINLDDPNAEKLIGNACRTWGVFQVKNHGVPAGIVDEIESAGRRLFSLPIGRKLRAARSPDGGLSGYGAARISSFFPKKMWSEGFTVVGSPEEHARRLWPQDYGMFCNVIEEYKKQMKKLAGVLMWLMLGSLGITRHDIHWAGPYQDFEEAMAALQFNSYPACPDPDRAMGLAPHTDSTMITILHQNNTSGLQVFRDETGWVTVPPTHGALVVNTGDLFHILSNGLCPSVRHRVMVNKKQHRFSVAYLYGPPTTVRISPHPKLVDSGHPPLYRPVTWAEYLGTKAQHFDKALSTVRICGPLNGFVDPSEQNNSVVVS